MKIKMLGISMALGVLALAGGSTVARAGAGSGTGLDSAGEGTGEQVAESLEANACMPELICGAVIGGSVLCQVFPNPGEDVAILWEDASGPYATEGTIQAFSCLGVDEVFVEVSLFYPGDRDLILRQTTECL